MSPPHRRRVWRIALLRTAASLVPAVAITGLAGLILHERGWVAMAWLVPGIAMALVSLALSIGVTIEHAAIGVVIAWIAAPVGVSRLAADRIAATAGLGQLVAVGAAALAALAITNRRSFLDFRGT